MPVKLYSAALLGLQAHPVEVEVDLAHGLHSFTIVGLPDKVVEESKERINAAIKNIGASAPRKQNQRLIVNLAPADIKKEGSCYDLPIAIGYLLASDQLKCSPDRKIFVGELALDGSLRPIPGILSIVQMAKTKGFTSVFLPKMNANEAALIEGIEIIAPESLSELILHLEGNKLLQTSNHSVKLSEIKQAYPVDFKHIKGQHAAKRALEIAASGSHNLLAPCPQSDS